MSPAQINAAQTLLKKVAPDLKAIDLNVESQQIVEVQIINYTDAVIEKAVQKSKTKLAIKHQTENLPMIDVTPAKALTEAPAKALTEALTEDLLS